MKQDVFIDGYIGQGDFFTSGFALKDLREQVTAVKDITVLDVHINSGGGSVTEGFAIHDYLKNLPNEIPGLVVNTIVEGMCGSIATVVAQSNSEDGKRYMHPNSEYFIHNPYYVPDGPNPMEAKDIESLHEDIKKAEDKLVNFYVGVTGKPEKEIREKMATQTSFTSDEAKAMGFVDEIIGQEIKAFTKYRIAAFINNKPNNNMDFKAFNESLKKIEANIEKLIGISKKVVAAKLETEGGTLFYDGELAAGTAVFSDEAMTTPATDGDYTSGNNKYTVKDGKVTEVTDTTQANADSEALAKQNADLKKANEDLTSQLKAANEATQKLEANLAEATEGIKTISADFQNFKAQFVTGTGEIKPEFQGFSKDGKGKDNRSWLEILNEKREAEKAK